MTGTPGFDPASRWDHDSAIAIAGLAEVVPLGAGGAAMVYRARQVAFDRQVAVKLLTAPLADGAARTRFAREQRLTGRLTGHPHIARVFDAGFTASGQPYLIMEYYAAGTLRDLVNRAGPQDPGLAMAAGVKLAGALATAHAAGILHRDIKPANVLLDEFGEPHLADFGISGMSENSAELTHAYTTRYAAPEVLARNPVFSEASDQYSLGLTLLFLLKGETPTEDDPISALAALGAAAPGPLRAVIERSLSEDPTQRFADVADLGRGLQEAQVALGHVTTPLQIQKPDSSAYSRSDTTTFRDRPVTGAPRSRPNPSLGFAVAQDDIEDALTRRRGQAPGGAPQPVRPARKRLLIALGGVTLAAVVAGGIAGVLRSGGGEQEAAMGTTSPPRAPSDLRIVKDTAAELKFEWVDTNDGQVAYAGYTLAKGSAVGEKKLDFATNKGATSETTPGFAPGLQHCVMVFPVPADGGSPSLKDATATVCSDG